MFCKRLQCPKRGRPPVRGAIKPVSGRAADLDRTNPGGGNLVGLILPITRGSQQALPKDFVTQRGDGRPTTLGRMRLVEITRAAAGERRQALVAFVERLAGEAGSRPLSDHLW